MDDLAVTTRGQQHHHRRRIAGVLEAGSEEVALHVIDAEKGFSETPGHGPGEREADDQSSGEAGPLSGRDRVQIQVVDAGFGQGAVGEGANRLDVSPGGHLGDDAPESGVLVHLGGEHAGANLQAVDHGHRGFVATRLHAQYQRAGHGKLLSISSSRWRYSDPAASSTHMMRASSSR